MLPSYATIFCLSHNHLISNGIDLDSHNHRDLNGNIISQMFGFVAQISFLQRQSNAMKWSMIKMTLFWIHMVGLCVKCFIRIWGKYIMSSIMGMNVNSRVRNQFPSLFNVILIISAHSKLNSWNCCTISNIAYYTQECVK